MRRNYNSSQSHFGRSSSYADTKKQLRYPDSLSPSQCQNLYKVVKASGEDAQLLLDVLANRLRSQHEIIINLADYFLDLQQALQQQKHTASVAKSERIMAQKEALKKHQADLVTEYRKYYTICQKIRNNMQSKHFNLTFQDALEKENMQSKWNMCQQRLAQAEHKLMKEKLK